METLRVSFPEEGKPYPDGALPQAGVMQVVAYTALQKGVVYVVAESCKRQYASSSTRKSDGISLGVCVVMVHQTKVKGKPFTGQTRKQGSSHTEGGGKGAHTPTVADAVDISREFTVVQNVSGKWPKP